MNVSEIGHGLKNTKQNFKAGKTKFAFDAWKQLTNDKWIINTIVGYKLEVNIPPIQVNAPRPYKFSPKERTEIHLEIQKFLKQNVIEENGEFISNIFYRSITNNKIRIILNLKPFNKITF
ncbi:hypothetical protein MAR_010241 [Mya arenaria]|uniref:Uncharacterized protein n=1 Tax=Mya arenaria TaxID=6604 RepID=A0ABY7E4G2_MYAAR|nr:hypothetical protein MAR_010241 [Mya arenaria]